MQAKEIIILVPYIGTLLIKTVNASDDIEALDISIALEQDGFEQIEISLPDEEGIITVSASKIIPTSAPEQV